MRHSYLIVGQKRKAPVGCFPLAITKIMAHYQFPSVYYAEGSMVMWYKISPDIAPNDTIIAARVLYSVAKGCDSWFFEQGTFTFPWEATSFMRSIGFKNVDIKYYSFDVVKTQLDRGRPLLFYAMPNVKIQESHCWNIDGYYEKERVKTTKEYKNGNLARTETETGRCKMVHCDFGWQTKCNGYYVSGVFKLDDSRVEHDPDTYWSGDTNYNNWLINRLITYEIP